jgi:hypothetical protein
MLDGVQGNLVLVDAQICASFQAILEKETVPIPANFGYFSVGELLEDKETPSQKDVYAFAVTAYEVFISSTQHKLACSY